MQRRDSGTDHLMNRALPSQPSACYWASIASNVFHLALLYHKMYYKGSLTPVLLMTYLCAARLKLNRTETWQSSWKEQSRRASGIQKSAVQEHESQFVLTHLLALGTQESNSFSLSSFAIVQATRSGHTNGHQALITTQITTRKCTNSNHYILNKNPVLIRTGFLFKI